ncbi:MAG: class II aldolase/adducin family protein [Terracidiphilus sp.]
MKVGKKKTVKTTARSAGAARPGRASTAAQAGRAARKPATRRDAANSLFSSPEAEAIKKEICAAGRKLWMRQYVDGNGGNISYRIGPNAVLCTPSLVSKFDLTPADLCLTDINGKQIAGSKTRSSELLLHLEIYKAVPQAKAVVHCHPPHATAYAITGCLPPSLIIPEFEVIVGKVAVAPYETPGTMAFAETVLPYVKNHNTVLLANHGIVCWADTVTRAEWCAEVLDTYCWILMLAAQLGAPILRISEQHGADLRALRKKLGLPEFPLDMPPLSEAHLKTQSPIALKQASSDGSSDNGSTANSAGGRNVETQPLIKALTESVMAAIAEKYTLVPRE